MSTDLRWSGARARRRIFAMFTAGCLALAFAATSAVGSPAASCANAIVCENQLAGTPESVWDINGSGDAGLQGFATANSVNVGGSISFKVTSNFSSFSIDIYRIGYYQGNGARRVASVTPTSVRRQPACLTDAPTGLVDCGNWTVSASWTVPSTAVSGVYIARLFTSGGAASHIIFVVRNDASTSAVLFRTNDTTWQAYNQYGGNSLYVGNAPSSDGRAYKVSFNRPYGTRGQVGGDGPSNFFFYAEYPMIRWLEANGYDTTYMSEVDPDRSPSLLLNHSVFVAAGHDEYWSAAQRAAVENARDHGVSLTLLTGNDMFWKVRWENSIDGSGTAYRTLVCYKETKSAAAIDPADPPTWTGTWRDPTNSPPADGGRPENGTIGQIFTVNRGSNDVTVSSQYSRLRLWRNTGVATLAPGQSEDLGYQTIGYEWDEDLDNGFRPGGTFQLSSLTASVPERIQDYGNTYGPGTATHHLTMYRAASGALVFAAGTVQWSWALDTDHDSSPDVGPSAPTIDAEQAMVNLFADMHVQPGSLQGGLTLATASSDSTAPRSTITSPPAGTSVTSGNPVTISGTASDSGGGVVASVEVSVDAGTTWHPAAGTSSWTYSWTAGAPGQTAIKSRAVDDSGNIESASAGVTITVNPRTCPCTLFGNATPANPASGDGNGVEVGTKFTVDSNGTVTGVRFYKGSTNTGTHIGNLWTAGGTLLASGTFSSETSSGWQTLTFASPVAVQPNTVYVASYHTATGHYAADSGFFTSAWNVWPMHGPATSSSTGGNGVYIYGGTQFPTASFNSTNYWVDAVYNSTASTTPIVENSTPAPNATGVSYAISPSVGFNENVVASSISFTVAPSGGSPVAGTTSYNATTFTATFTPSAVLALGTTYTATVSGATDASGNAMQQPYSWSFTTKTCPCSLFAASSVPALPSSGDASALEIGVKFTTDVGGYVNGVKFYKGTGNTGTHIGNLWSAGGQLLATAVFSNETATGWQQVLFPSPVAISPNTVYIASYHTDAGNYSYNGGFFTTTVDNPPVHSPTSASSGGNGVFAYSGASTFPNQTYNSANYWVDVLFNAAFLDTVAPSVLSTSPASGATNVYPAAVTATLSKPVTASSINFTLTGTSSVAGTTSYNSATNVATFTPSATLASGTTYTANLSGATDSAGNVMTPYSWSFTTTPCPCTVFSASATPAVADANDGGSVELGMKFTPTVNGYVTGVRFYKGATNTGTHVGSLWSSSGALLAQVTFTNETASGWQQATFSQRVVVTAGTTYVISYHAPVGQYAYTGAYFGSAVNAPPLQAPANGTTQNGVYAYAATSTFPNQSWNATNYWVDVVFTTS